MGPVGHRSDCVTETYSFSQNWLFWPVFYFLYKYSLADILCPGTRLRAKDTKPQQMVVFFPCPGISSSPTTNQKVVFRVISSELSMYNPLHFHVALLLYTPTWCCFLSLMFFLPRLSIALLTVLAF